MVYLERAAISWIQLPCGLKHSHFVARITPWEDARHVGGIKSPTLFFNPSISIAKRTQHAMSWLGSQVQLVFSLAGKAHQIQHARTVLNWIDKGLVCTMSAWSAQTFAYTFFSTDGRLSERVC